MSRHHGFPSCTHPLLVAAALAAWTVPGAGRAHDGWGRGVVSPQVVHTRSSPTGYQVTFRYYAPTATRVQVRGEWYFSDEADTTTSSSAGWLPSQWIPGAFPIAYPNNGAAANWPVQDMTLDASTGIWSFTTPMPPGTFTYGFYVDCTAAAPALTGCTELSDPGNPPWNTAGSIEPTSQVYVPYDARFGGEDFSWQAPSWWQGTLADVTYSSPESTSPVGQHYLAVYLPPGYDPHRRLPYPTLYLSHGAGGNEVDWTTQGVAGRIIDNLLATGQAQPMVVVMTNLNSLGTCSFLDPSCYRADLLDNVIPYVEANYNVSSAAADRAFGGLSMGAMRANDLLFNATTTFGYIGSWSIGSWGSPAATDPLWQNPDLKTRLGLHIGGGRYDSLTATKATYEATFAANGIPFVDDTVDGGHEWYVWRILLHDFVSGVAFRHTTTSLRQGPGRWSAGWPSTFLVEVDADTTEAAPPTGTVQLYVDGKQIGRALPVRGGGVATAVLPGLGKGSHTVTAVYGGDRFYNGSTSAAVTVGP